MQGWWRYDLWEDIRTQPVRLGLAFLAIAIGILVFTLLVTILAGLRTKSRMLVEELGGDVMIVLSDSNGLSQQHMDQLQHDLPDVTISRVTAYSVDHPFEERRITLLASDHRLFETRPWKLREGRLFDPVDVSKQQLHAVVSEGLATSARINAGHILPLRDTYLQVTGVLKKHSMDAVKSEGFEQIALGQEFIVVPHTLTPYWDTSSYNRRHEISAFFVKANTHSIQKIKPRIERLLNQDPDIAKTISIITPDTLRAGIQRLQQTIQWATGSVAFLCLLLGGATLMSLMIANVKERITEIGLRMALGATPNEIMLLFIGEGLLVTTAAGIVGSTAATAILLYGKSTITLPIQISPGIMAIPLVLAILFGIIFTWWPARQAAQIEPSQALRNE